MLQGAHLGVEGGLRRAAPVDRVALKKAERLVEAHLLAAVDQGHALLHRGTDHVGGLGVGADALLDRSVPRILVVVVDEVHAVAVLREVLLLALQVGIDRGDVLALAGLVEQVVELPAVGHVALRLVGPVELGFAQQKDLGILGAQHRVGLLPELEGLSAHHVVAKAVDLHVLEPPHQLALHGRPQLFVGVVELSHVGPVGGLVVVVAAVADFAGGRIAVVELRVLGHPVVVPRRVVRNPVQNHLHSELVGPRRPPWRSRRCRQIPD